MNTFGRDPGRGFAEFKGTPEEADKLVRSERESARIARGEDDNHVNVFGMNLPTPAGVLAANPDSVSNYQPVTGLGQAAKTTAGVATGVLGGGAGGLGAATRIGAGILGGEMIKDRIPDEYLTSQRFGVHPDEGRNLVPAVTGLGLGAAPAVGRMVRKPLLGWSVPSQAEMEAQGLSWVRHAEGQVNANNPASLPTLTGGQAEQLRAAGIYVPPYMTMSPSVKEFLAQQAQNDPALRARLEAMNTNISQHRDIASRLESVNAQRQARNDINYRRVQAMPHAQDVWSPELERIYSHPTMKRFVDEARDTGEQRDLGVRGPVYREPVDPVRARGFINENNTGWNSIGDQPGVPAGYTRDPNSTPNLVFHSRVNERMKTVAKQMREAGDDDGGNALNAMRKRMLKGVDRIVPEFETDVLAPSRLMQQNQRAAELAAQASTDVTGFKIPDAVQPQGVMGRVGSAIAHHPFKAFTAPGLVALGADAMGAAPAMPMLTNTLHFGIPAAIGAGALSAIPLAVRMARKGIRAERQGAANKVIADQLLEPTPLLPQAERGAPAIPANDPEMRPLTITRQRKAGGEVGSMDGKKLNIDAEAQALVTMVQHAREGLSGQTQNLLQSPDTHVVQALSVAKHALG
jgi:hypothetical protein